MNKKFIIKESKLFDSIIHDGHKLINKYYIVFYLENEFSYPKFGFAIGKKNGNAVTRNKIKRQLKSIISMNKSLFKNNNNYIIMVRKDYFNLDFEQKKSEFINLLEKVK